jgi:hypothetical protein
MHHTPPTDSPSLVPTPAEQAQAQHVAANPDGVSLEELLEFVKFVDTGRRLALRAELLWPPEVIRQMPKQKTPIKGQITAAIALRDYCAISATCQEYRLAGKIEDAIRIEKLKERMYLRIPPWARW